MASHAAKIKLRYAVVQALESRCLAEFEPPRFNGIGKLLNSLIPCNPFVVIVIFVDASCVGTNKVPLDGLKVAPSSDEAEKNRFEPSSS